jgi:hypothetical protein
MEAFMSERIKILEFVPSRDGVDSYVGIQEPIGSPHLVAVNVEEINNIRLTKPKRIEFNTMAMTFQRLEYLD